MQTGKADDPTYPITFSRNLTGTGSLHYHGELSIQVEAMTMPFQILPLISIRLFQLANASANCLLYLRYFIDHNLVNQLTNFDR